MKLLCLEAKKNPKTFLAVTSLNIKTLDEIQEKYN